MSNIIQNSKLKVALSILLTILISFSLTACFGIDEKEGNKGNPDLRDDGSDDDGDNNDPEVDDTWLKLRKNLLTATTEKPVVVYDYQVSSKKTVDVKIGSMSGSNFLASSQTNNLDSSNKLLRVKHEGATDYETYYNHIDGKVFNNILVSTNKLDLLFLDKSYVSYYSKAEELDIYNYENNNENLTPAKKQEVVVKMETRNKSVKLLEASVNVVYKGIFNARFMNFQVRKQDDLNFENYEDDEVFSGKMSFVAKPYFYNPDATLFYYTMDFDKAVTAKTIDTANKTPSRPGLNRIEAVIQSPLRTYNLSGNGERPSALTSGGQSTEPPRREKITSLGKVKYGTTTSAQPLQNNATEYEMDYLSSSAVLQHIGYKTMAIIPDTKNEQAAQVGSIDFLVISENPQPVAGSNEDFNEIYWYHPDSLGELDTENGETQEIRDEKVESMQKKRGYLEVMRFVFASNERILPE